MTVYLLNPNSSETTTEAMAAIARAEAPQLSISGLTAPFGPAMIIDEPGLTVGAEAVAVGWKDPLLCDQGRGKYFQKVASEGFPYTLMYSSENELIGIYLISDTEKPAPWELTEEIKGGAGPIIDYEHWGLSIYFRDPTRACSIKHSGTCAQVPC